MTGEPRSPAFARALLGLLIPSRYRDNQLGDLEEEFRTRGRSEGWTAARRWYWRQAITSLPGSGRLRYREERDSEQGRGGAAMERWFQDFKYSVRALLKSPQHTIIATLTLGLAIGVNTAIFSLVNQVLFIDLPMEDPDEVYWVWQVSTETQSGITSMSLPNFQDFREQTRAFESIAAMQQDPMILTGVDQPERITVARVTANLMEVWRDQPTLGRGFVVGEDLPGAPKVAMITHSMWENRFGASPDVLGRTLRLNDLEYTIVGVTSQRMETGNFGRASVWIPLDLSQSGNREIRGAVITGRLRPGVTLAEAQAEGARIGERLADEHPTVNAGWVVQVRTTDDSILGDQVATIMTLLVLTVGLVLLIACANVANLVLVRASSRTRELAMRSALGASRSRLIGQLLTENMLIALVAGGMGIGLAHLLLRGLVALTRGQQMIFTIAVIDERVLVFTLIVSLAAPLFFGLLPALGAVRSNLTDSLRDGDRAGAGRKGGRTRSALVVSQVALALSLMIVSSVLARSVIAIQGIELGIQTDGVLSMVIELPGTRYDADGTVLFFRELEDRVGSIPSVQRVALAGSRPSVTIGGGTPFAIEGQDEARPENLPTAYTEVVSEHYFDVLGIPLIQGRTFDDRDGNQTSQVAVVSREAVDRFWPGEDVLGRRVRIGLDPTAPWRQIVGVVENVAGGNDLENPNVPQIYMPFSQAPRSAMVLLARANGDEAALTGAIREEVWAIDPQQPIDDVRTMEAYLYDRNSFGFAIISMFIAFALFALAMAGMGIYGVMSFMVSQRTREIGLRMALGAERASVLRLVLGQGSKLVVIGSLIGLGFAFVLTRLTANLVFGVEPTDPVAFIGVPLVLMVIALAANFIPAYRATRIDPMQTLRGD